MQPENKNNIATANTANTTPFNLFDTLRVLAKQITKEQINQHFCYVLLYLVCATTTPLFPTQAKINATQDYLRDMVVTPRIAKVVTT
jgi:hypothetical protein